MTPLNIAVLNLMPTKQVTQCQIESIFKEAGANANFTWLATATYQSKNTDAEYLKHNYVTFENIKDKAFDVFIITGAPVEHMPFEQVAYWQELTKILDFTKTNSKFNIFICWAAQAALYHFYKINKQSLPEKCFGLFNQDINNKNSVFYKNIEPGFIMPHSRHTSLTIADIAKNKKLVIESSFGKELSAISSLDGKNLFITGHPEYDADTLHLEYKRDLEKGEKIKQPENYYLNNNSNIPPVNTWRKEAVTFYQNIIHHVRIRRQK